MDRVVKQGVVEGELTPPSSKSYAQRALAVSLLTEGVTTIGNVEFCDDTLSAMRTIESLGADVKRLDESTLEIRGGLNPRSSSIFIGESGLATRLFTPIASLLSNPIRIEGHGSILKRPMSMMIEPLRRAGVHIVDNAGYLPLEVCGPLKGGTIEVDGSISSQFITGLLLALPKAQSDTTLFVDGAVSLPYIDMTIDTARKFGVEIAHNDYSEFFIAGGQRYNPIRFDVEGDWSAASSLLVAGAIAGDVTMHNLSMLSMQADRVICDALVAAGAQVESQSNTIRVSHRSLRGFEFDASNSPDLFPSLVALAVAAEGESRIKGITRLVHKESNRALTLREEYTKVGVEIELLDDVMVVHPSKICSARVKSHNDHRIAMSLAVAALLSDGEIVIEESESVSKSYPAFFEDLESLRK